jgi:hypothetical protein
MEPIVLYRIKVSLSARAPPFSSPTGRAHYTREDRMLNAHVSGVVTGEHTASRVHRPGMRTFWALFALEAALVFAVAAVLLNVLPQRTPLSQTADAELLRAAVLSRLDGTLDDPVVEVAPGVTVRSSALRGLELGGVTYHYYFEGQRGFDPLSRGKLRSNDVEVVVRDSDGERTLVIYRILTN